MCNLSGWPLKFVGQVFLLANFKILKTIFILTGWNGGARTQCIIIIIIYIYIYIVAHHQWWVCARICRMGGFSVGLVATSSVNAKMVIIF